MYTLCRSLRLTVGAFNIHCARLFKYSGRKANSSKHRKQSIIQQCYPNPQTISRPGLSFLTDHIVNRRSGSAVPCRSDENVYLQQVYVRLSTGQVDQLEDRYIGIVEVASSNLALSTHSFLSDTQISDPFRFCHFRVLVYQFSRIVHHRLLSQM